MRSTFLDGHEYYSIFAADMPKNTPIRLSAVRLMRERPVDGSLPKISALKSRESSGAVSMSIASWIDVMQ